jgi:DNA invertase Pin-like site-specific DNA recombinase
MVKHKEAISMEKAVCYVRVSTMEQATQGVSLEAQEEKLIAYCKMYGLEIVKIIKEEGISATKPLKDRPGGKELMGLVNSRKVNNVVALKLDRLFRNAEDALHVTRDWDSKGVSLHLVDMGGQVINTKTAIGRFFLNMMAGFAELERNMIAERTAMALEHKKRNLEPYAPTPLGFERIDDTLKKNDEEWEIVNLIFQLRSEKISYAKIAEELNNRGIPGKRGGKWYGSTVRYVFQNDLYKKEVNEVC